VIIKGDTGSALIQDIGKYKIHIGIASFISGNGCESTDPSGIYSSWTGTDFGDSSGVPRSVPRKTPAFFQNLDAEPPSQCVATST
jgi:hypothetical protein